MSDQYFLAKSLPDTRAFSLTVAIVIFCFSPAGLAAQEQQPTAKKRRPVRLLLVEMKKAPRVKDRLIDGDYEVSFASWDEFRPDAIMGIDVIILPTEWASDPECFAKLESHATKFHSFVKRGGGLLVCQPNRNCSPKLLPFPITFHQHYDDKDITREILDDEHFLTEGLKPEDMPFPFDGMTEIDERYSILAQQSSTQSPSLAVATFGDGRIVVQSGNENKKPAPKVLINDVMFDRLIQWAAMRDTE